MEIKELLMGVLDQLQHHQRGTDSLPTCIQGLGGSVLPSTKQDASFLCEYIEIRLLMIVAIIGVKIHLNMDEPSAGKTSLC